MREVGRALNAGYVVEGSARRAGDRLRVVAQLIDARSGAHLWSQSYDRRIEDVLTVQADLTTHISAALLSYVRQSEVAAVRARPTRLLACLDLVLQGRSRYDGGKLDPDALHAARELFARAVAVDPSYAAAHAYLGLTYIVDQMNAVTDTRDRRSLATGLDHIRTALRLEPDLPLAFRTLSSASPSSGDFEGAMRAAERAVELNASDPDSLMSLAKAQVRFGAYGEAVANAELARRLHPFAPQYYPYVHGQALYAAGRAADADDVLADCLVRAPEERNCLRMQAAVLARLGRTEEARELMARLTALDPRFSIAQERTSARFGASPLMETYLADLAAAGAPAMAGQARAPGAEFYSRAPLALAGAGHPVPLLRHHGDVDERHLEAGNAADPGRGTCAQVRLVEIHPGDQPGAVATHAVRLDVERHPLGWQPELADGIEHPSMITLDPRQPVALHEADQAGGAAGSRDAEREGGCGHEAHADSSHARSTPSRVTRQRQWLGLLRDYPRGGCSDAARRACRA